MIFTYMWEEFIGMEGTEQEINNPAWTCIRNARRVLDVFRSIPVITFLDISRLEFSV